jgi:uncharacterized RDD family membrane protein YckC
MGLGDRSIVATTVTAITLPDGWTLASIGRRALAAIIDLVVVGVGIWLPFFVKWGHVDSWDHQYKVTGQPAFVLFFLAASYWIFTEWPFGATFGKLMCDLRVVSIKGTKCKFTQSLQRNLARALDVVGFYLVGYMAAKFSPLRQRLGDQWARTIVIVTPKKLLETRD